MYPCLARTAIVIETSLKIDQSKSFLAAVIVGGSSHESEAEIALSANKNWSKCV